MHALQQEGVPSLTTLTKAKIFWFWYCWHNDDLDLASQLSGNGIPWVFLCTLRLNVTNQSCAPRGVKVRSVPISHTHMNLFTLQIGWCRACAILHSLNQTSNFYFYFYKLCNLNDHCSCRALTSQHTNRKCNLSHSSNSAESHLQLGCPKNNDCIWHLMVFGTLFRPLLLDLRLHHLHQNTTKSLPLQGLSLAALPLPLRYPTISFTTLVETCNQTPWPPL